MKLNIHIFKIKPSETQKPLIDATGIEELLVENVEKIEFNDTAITVYYNTGEKELIMLRGNDGVAKDEWRGVSLFAERKLLNIDMSK